MKFKYLSRIHEFNYTLNHPLSIKLSDPTWCPLCVRINLPLQLIYNAIQCDNKCIDVLVDSGHFKNGTQNVRASDDVERRLVAQAPRICINNLSNNLLFFVVVNKHVQYNVWELHVRLPFITENGGFRVGKRPHASLSSDDATTSKKRGFRFAKRVPIDIGQNIDTQLILVGKDEKNHDEN